MKRSVLRFALPITVLIALPMSFNSCQGGLLGNGFMAKQSCKVGLEKGIVTKMAFDSNITPQPFAAGKVNLGPSSSSANGSLSKATAAPDLSAGRRLAVILDNSCLDRSQATVISQMAIASGERMSALNRQAYEWKLERAYTEEELNTLAAADSCVVGVSWNKDYKIAALTFNDSSFSNQAHFPSVRAQEAYSLFYGNGGAMSTTTGNPVVIAVVDTGIDWMHPDLKNNLWVHSQGVGIDITTLGTSLVDFNPFDVSDFGHGTHVAGLIAAIANNSQGTVGLMPYRAKLMAIKVFKRESNGDLSTTSNFFFNALQFAYLNNADVINLSLGSVTSGSASDPVAESGLDEALQRGVTVTTVIGNADTGNGQNIDGNTMTSIPGIYASKAGVVGVGSYDVASGGKSYFSHYSTTYAEIAAPGAESSGTGIYSTLPTAQGSYGRLSGTSQSAPLVAAAAGLTIGLIRNAYGIDPTPAEVERLLLTSAVKSTALTTYFKNGNRLDLLNLAQKINTDYPNTRVTSTAGPPQLGANSPCP
ncbi:MAG: S8 family serine peptidase [Bdellovibrionales bacterium]|nr:S8 family serine peptidase [Bdellovibrionales bacterium]